MRARADEQVAGAEGHNVEKGDDVGRGEDDEGVGGGGGAVGGYRGWRGEGVVGREGGGDFAKGTGGGVVEGRGGVEHGDGCGGGAIGVWWLQSVVDVEGDVEADGGGW